MGEEDQEIAQEFDREIDQCFAHLANERARKMANVYQRMVKEKLGLDLSVFAKNILLDDVGIKEKCRRVILNSISKATHTTGKWPHKKLK